MKNTTGLIVLTLTFLVTTVFLFSNIKQQVKSPDQPSVLAATSHLTSLNISAVQPANGSTNVSLNPSIVITFSRDVASSEASFSISPPYSYSISYTGNVVTVSANEALLPGTLYTYVIKYADKTIPVKTYTFQTIGPTQKYLPDTKPTAALDELNTFQRQNHPDIFLANHTPYNGDTFTVTSNYREGAGGHFYFVVSLRPNQVEKGKNDFMAWLSSLKLEPDQIGKLDIDYRK